MWRTPLLLLAFAAIAPFEFWVYPGHTFLRGGTQVDVPALERLQAPGLLSRDLVATHPNLTDTAYDEVTLLLGRLTRSDTEHCLAGQLFACRLASLLGVFWLARSTGVRRPWAIGVSALVNLGTFVPGPAFGSVATEPTPAGFALSLVLLASGAFATGKPLLAGFAGGLAVLYDWRFGAPFWLVTAAGYSMSGAALRMLRASLPILAVFVLLLANLAQLQPGAAEVQSVWARVPPAIAAIQRFRTPDVWVSGWTASALIHGIAVILICVWATARLWTALPRPARPVFVGLPLLGALGVVISAMSLDWAHWYIVAQIAPARLLSFTAAFALLACFLAGLRQWRFRHRTEGTALLLCGFLLLFIQPPSRGAATIHDVAQWAAANTWGGSMFAFPDAREALDPGQFRAESRRAVWVDWETGRLADFSDSFADEWYRRWQDTMAGEYSDGRLRTFLPLPIDYFVLRKSHALRHVEPVFRGRDLLVYDTRDLRLSSNW